MASPWKSSHTKRACRNSVSRYVVENLESRTLLNAADLDTAFGSGGRVQTTLSGNGLELFNSAVVQSDGKLLVAGYAFGYYTANYGIVARYNTNGTIDSTFGTSGRFVFSSVATSQFNSVALQADGKIVLGGLIGTGQQQTGMFAARLTAAGALDTTFNSTGMETFASSGGFDGVAAVAVQSDGKIVLVGSSSNGTLLRLTSTGALDTTFGTGGKSTTSNLSILGIVFDSAGRAVIEGKSGSATAIARFTTAGALDASFANAGIFTTTIGSFDTPAGVKIQSDGKIVVGGSSSGNYYAIRLGTTGALDSTFASGSGIFKAAGTGNCVTMGLTSTGAIVLAGGTTSTTSSGPVSVMRVTSAGALDTTFNSTGKVSLGTGINVHGGIVRSTGVVDVLGRVYSTYNASISQVTAAGALDSTFNSTGQVSVNFPVPIAGELQRTAIQPDGKLIVASTVDVGYDYFGYSTFPPAFARYYGSVIELTRYTTAGALDSTFGTSGVVTVALGSSCVLRGLELLASGDIAVAGSYLDASSDNQGVLKYLLPSGAPDTSFGAAGQLTLAPFTGHTSTFFSALSLAPNGDLLLAGSTFDTATTWNIVAIKPTGGLDSSYGTGGVILPSGQVDYIAADSSGNVLTYTYQHLIRYLVSGAVDPSFVSNAGSFDPTPTAGINGLVIQPDGKIILVGNGGNSPNGVTRHTSTGAIDGTFGGGGYLLLPNPSHFLNSAYVLPNGNIVIAGEQSLSSFADGYVAELDSRGALVPGFGTNGSVTLSFGESTPITVNFGDIAVRPNGQIVIAGTEANNLVVAQFQGTVPDVITGTVGNDQITLSQSADHQSITWTQAGISGALPIADAAGLTINGNGGLDTITLLNANGSPLPNRLHLNGTFTINGLAGSNPLANTSLDIGRGPVYISYANAAADPVATLRGYLKNGYAGGLWTGTPTTTTGVVTSPAASGDPTHTSGIGYADSADGVITLPANTIELKYTLYGDTGLSGSVGFTDFMRMTQHYTKATGATWVQGDFNYDGAVGTADFALLQPNYGLTLPLPTPMPAVIPARPQRVTTIPPGVSLNTATSVSAVTMIEETPSKKRAKAKHQKKNNFH